MLWTRYVSIFELNFVVNTKKKVFFVISTSFPQIEPKWQATDFFSVYELQKAMDRDSGLVSHPISFPVKNSVDIRRIFDPISYSKGASVIRMVHHFIGQNAFKDSLRQYLKKFEYSNAVHDDLWNIMTENAHKYDTLPKDMDIKQIMET